MRLHSRALSAALIATLTIAGAAASMVRAGVVPDFGIDWVTIGAPGNAAYDGPNGAFSPPVQGRGSVPYTYRMSRTEITASQWFEFVQAYGPFVDPTFRNTDTFTSTFISQSGLDANGNPTYFLDPVLNDFAVSVGWRFAARFANWLHNGKAITRDAFESGAYNTSTFGNILDEEGRITGFTDQLAHAPDARFWIPTLDEWMKAVHYDPNRFGPGQGGWWMHPNAQDEPLTPGLPGEAGAQSSAGVTGVTLLQLQKLFEVGLYPDVDAPWGLLDVSGTQPEWTESSGGGNFVRFVDGDPVGSLVFGRRFDQVNEFTFFGPSIKTGLRLASVPNPGTLSLYLLTAAMQARRKRRQS